VLSLSLTILAPHASKRKVVLSLIKHHTMKEYEEIDLWAHAFLTPALDGSEWVSYMPHLV